MKSNTPNITLVPISIDQISHLFDMAYRIWHAHYTPIIGEEQVRYMLAKMYSPRGLAESMREGQRFYWIMLDELKIGFIAITHDRNLFIHKFYIDIEYQGRGIGSRVLAELIMQQQPESITLTVNRANYKSINFYFKNGFVIDHVADFDIGEGYWMNDFVMKRKL